MKQKDQDVYFVGKVLNASEMPDDNAKTFAFTKEERASLDLKDIPIQLEHEESMQVGKIKNSWFDTNNQMWVMGEINGKDIPSTFAKYALQSSGKNNKHQPYYTGLSLSHVHREYASGKTEKVPIEVSLCTDPRRPNCKIIYASNNKSNKNTYKCIEQVASKSKDKSKKNNSNNMSAVATEQQQQQQQVPQPAVTEQTQQVQQVQQQQQGQQQQQQANGDQLSQQVYDEMSSLYKRDKEQQEQIAKMQAELEKHQKTLKEAENQKQEEMAQKGRAIMATFLEHMKDLVGDDAMNLQQDVEPMIATNPEQMHRVMEVVAKASKKFKDQNNELRTAKSDLRDKELELKFQTLIKQNTNGLAQVNTQVVESASRKRSAPSSSSSSSSSSTTQMAAKQSINTFNPYKTVGNINRQQSKGRPNRPGMNKELLNAFKSVRTGGNGYNSMNSLHKDLAERRRTSYY